MASQVTDDKQIQIDRLKGFLVGLTALRQAFGMEVGGCGECGSAWVYDVLTDEYVGHEIEWDPKHNDWKFDQGSILPGDEPIR